MSRTLGTQENGPAAPPPQQIAAGQAGDSSPSAITGRVRSRAYKNRTRRLRTRQTADVLPTS